MNKNTQVVAWQRLEGLGLFLMAIIIFGNLWGNWWFFVPAFFAPDLGILGYAVNKKVGAWSYNLTHNLFLPGLLATMSVPASYNHIDSGNGLFLIAMIWFAHIGFDRVLGYGLKYDDGFKHTHLGLIGKK